jgi:hypothetical protein
MPVDQLPQGLWPYFQEYNPDQLNLELDKDLIMQRTLEFGTWDEVRWLFRRYGKQLIQTFLRKRGKRMLSPVTFHYWCKLLKIGKLEPSPFPTQKGDLWYR